MRVLRSEKRLLQKEVANEIGITPNTLARYERGEIQPSLENFFKLAQFFEVEMEKIILGDRLP